MKRALTGVENGVSIIVYIIMLIITFVNVIGRYCFHASISFTDEITANLFVLVSVMGTAMAARDRGHLGLGVVTELLPAKTQRVISAVGNFLGAAFGVVLFVTGIQMVQNQIAINAKTTTLMLPAWIYGIFLPIGAAFIVVRFIMVAIEDIRQVKSAEK